MVQMIALVTDSTCDLGPTQLAQLGVTVVPLRVHVDGRSWLDWEELDPDTLYRLLQDGQTATTTPPSVEDFVSTYRPLLADGRTILSLHLSGALSETVTRARAAAAHLGASDRIRVVDTRLTTAPLGELVIHAARWLAQGRGLDETLVALERLRGAMHIEFTVNDLDYLRRGGRLSRAGAMLGSLLGVRPILGFEDGRIVADRRVRDRSASDDMIARAEDLFGNRPVNVAIAYAGRDRDRLDQLRQQLEASSLNIRQGRIQLLGAVVGAYTGPGAFGFLAYPSDFSHDSTKTS